MEICSGYRTEAYNRKIGGAPKSQHMLGMAADIAIAGISPLEVAQYAEFLQPGAGGIGVYSTFTHVDVRTGRAAGITAPECRSLWRAGVDTQKAVRRSRPWSGSPGRGS